MTLEQHIDNWLAWLFSMSDDSPELWYPPHCGSIESRYPSPKNAGHGNADVGELPYDVQALQRQPKIVADPGAAKIFDDLVKELPRPQFLVFRFKRLPKKYMGKVDVQSMNTYRLKQTDDAAKANLAWQLQARGLI